MTFEMAEEIIIYAANSVENIRIKMKPTEIDCDVNHNKIKDAFQLVSNDTNIFKKLKNVSFIRI